MQPTDLLDSFLADAWEALTRFQALSPGLSKAPEPCGELKVLAHRLRGTAALYGYGQVASLAELLERILERTQHLHEDDLGDVKMLLQQAEACIYDALMRISRNESEGNVGLALNRLGGPTLLRNLLKRRPEAFLRHVAPRREAKVASQESLSTKLRTFHREQAEIWEFFAPEADEHIDAIYDALLTAPEPESLTALFRATHTLKGAAYMVDLKPLGDLAHHLEDLMVAVREDGRAFDDDVQAILRGGADTMRSLLRYAEGENIDIETTSRDFNKRLGRLLGTEADSDVSGAEDNDTFDRYDSELAPQLSDLLERLDAARLAYEGGDSDALTTVLSELQAFNDLAVAPLDTPSAHLLKLLKGSQLSSGELSEELQKVLRQSTALFADVLNTRDQENLSSRLTALEETLNSANQPKTSKVKEKERTAATIRVGLNKLDTLMDLSGEFISSRARMSTLLESFSHLQEDFEAGRARLERTVTDFSERYLNPDLSAEVAGNVQSTKSKSVSLSERFAELEFDSYNDFNILARSVTEMTDDLSHAQQQLDQIGVTFEGELEAMRKLSRSLHREVGRTRMIPIGTLFNRLRRLTGQSSEDKAFKLEVQGETVEVDNAILEGVADPLLHLLKNAIIHGIETKAHRLAAGKSATGTVSLSARQQGKDLYIEVRDDGHGIDIEAVTAKAVERDIISAEQAASLSEYEALDLIFTPGLSTAQELSTDAGRGVGMDAVKSNVNDLKGSIQISSQAGQGTNFSLRLPLTLLINEALLIQVGQQQLAFPADTVRTLRVVPADSVYYQDDIALITIEDTDAYFCDLRPLYGLEATGNHLNVVLIESSAQFYAFAADRFVNIEEVVVKGVKGILRKLPHLAGATVDSYGKVIPIFDPAALYGLRYTSSQPETPTVTLSQKKKLLLVDDSLSVRKIIGTLLSRADFDVTTAVDGQDALERLRGHDFDAILTDLEMPRLNGYELIEELRYRLARSTPVIVMTTRAAAKHMDLAFEMGADAYLTKPVDEKKLLASLHEVFGTRSKQLARG